MRPNKAVHGGDAFRYEGIVDFSSNVNPFGPSKKALQALGEALEDIRVYPDPDGSRLKKALGDYTRVDPSCITLGNGSTELIKNFCEVFVKEGDTVLVPVPTFSEYGVWLGHYGARIRELPLNEDLSIPTERIKEGMREGARALFLCNPNNPTGMLIAEEELEEILALAEETGTLILLDEAYIEFTRGKSLCQEAAASRHLFILRSLTKFFSLASLRVGFAVAHPQLIAQVEQARIPWNVNSFALEAALASLEDKEFIQEVKVRVEEEGAYLREGLEGLFRVVPSDATFFLMDLGGTGLTAPDLKAEMVKLGFLIRDCSSFQGLDENYFRVSIRTRKENQALLGALGEVLEGA